MIKRKRYVEAHCKLLGSALSKGISCRQKEISSGKQRPCLLQKEGVRSILKRFFALRDGVAASFRHCRSGRVFRARVRTSHSF